MFQRMIDDFKDSTGTAMRLTSLAAAAALALLVTTSFLCAAAFVYVLQRYGLIEACLTGAAVFFVVTLIAAGCYMVRKEQAQGPRQARPRNPLFKPRWPIPCWLRPASRSIRAIGIKKLIPILAVGGLALGFLASRNSSGDETPEA